MPFLKYTVVVGSALLALLFVAETAIPSQSSALSQSTTSLDVLRKMANHGEMRGFAPLAHAGAFLPMPLVSAQPVLAAANPIVVVKPVIAANTIPSMAMDAQARVVESDVIDRPARPSTAKKVAPRKPKQPRTDVVENVPRGSFGFFGGMQSW